MCEPSKLEVLADRFIRTVETGDEQQCERLRRRLDAIAIPGLGPSALWYASVGWPVFPLAADGDRPLGLAVRDASVDAKRIRSWWDRYPTANIGVVTGRLFDVISVHGALGFRSAAGMAESLPDVHGIVDTPDGQYWLVTPADGRSWDLPGVDYVARGGYVVLPPSRTGSGRLVWVMRPSPAIIR